MRQSTLSHSRSLRGLIYLIYLFVPMLLSSGCAKVASRSSGDLLDSHSVLHGKAPGPWQYNAVGMLSVVVDGEGYVCTATALSPWVLLTAAHCVAVPADSITFSLDQEPPHRVDVVRIHPAFRQYLDEGRNQLRFTADLALLRLAEPISRSAIPIFPTLRSSGISVGTELTSAGYGRDDLMRIGMKLVGTFALAGAEAAPDPLSHSIEGNSLLVSSLGTLQAKMCFGDSGGPAFDPNREIVGTFSDLVGVDSGLSRHDECATARFDGFTAVAPFMVWLRRGLQELEGGSCPAAGKMDTRFGAGTGKSFLNLPGYDLLPGYSLLQPDGKVVVCGQAHPINGARDTGSMAIARVNPDGSPDTAFGGDGTGLVTVDIGTNSNCQGLALQADGKILATGWSSTSGRASFALARLAQDGSLDSSFNGTGKKTWHNSPQSFDEAFRVGLDSRGRILITGSTRPTPDRTDIMVSRLDSSGALDPTFGNSGNATTSAMARSANGQVIAVFPDDSVLVGGFTYLSIPENSPVAALAHFLADGSLDPSFGTGGIRVLPELAVVFALDVFPDRKFLAGGAYLNHGRQDAWMGRFRPDGTPDPAFNGGRPLDIGFGTGMNQNGSTGDFALDSSGNIIVAGYAFGNNDRQFALARVSPDGTLDRCFGDRGIVVLPVSYKESDLRRVQVLADGSFLLAGSALHGNDTDFATAKYRP